MLDSLREKDCLQGKKSSGNLLLLILTILNLLLGSLSLCLSGRDNCRSTPLVISETCLCGNRLVFSNSSLTFMIDVYIYFISREDDTI